MKISDALAEWCSILRRGGALERSSLNHLLEDECLPKEVEQQFIEAVAERDCPAAPSEALSEVCSAVATSRHSLLCKGPPIPAETFVNLFRFERVSHLRYRAPSLLDDRGLTDADLQSMPEDELLDLVDGHAGGIDVTLGNALGIVWVTDFSALGSGDRLDPVLLLGRLGLTSISGEEYLISCAYRRTSATEPVAVPRSLDGLAQPLFLMKSDCNAGHGTTQSQVPGVEGLPEAVHPACQVRPFRWKLEKL